MPSIPHPTFGFNREIALTRLAAGWEVPLFVPEQKKPVAGLVRLADGTVELHKHVLASLHLTDIPPSIAFNAVLFRAACELGATVITVYDGETGDVYRTDTATFDRYAFTQDRQHGAQRFLKLYHWSINGQPPTYQPKLERTQREHTNDQLALFSLGGAQ